MALSPWRIPSMPALVAALRRTLLAALLALPLAALAQQLTVSAAASLTDAFKEIGQLDTVPVGRYTKQVLDSARAGSALEPKFVQADSVRQVLDYVARGEVEAGFVYRTDAALMADKVKVALTATGHTPVTYPVA